MRRSGTRCAKALNKLENNVPFFQNPQSIVSMEVLLNHVTVKLIGAHSIQVKQPTVSKFLNHKISGG